MGKSDLEYKFLNLWLTLTDLPEPYAEYNFARDIVGHGPGIRKRLREAGLQDWRFDFAWPDKLIAVELEGGVWARGRHVRGRGYESDCEKYNLAQSLGWSVYRFTSGMLERDPAACVEQVAAALGGEDGDDEVTAYHKRAEAFWRDLYDKLSALDGGEELPFTDLEGDDDE